ncbi:MULTISPECIES: DUF3579 domain-containing protein [Paraburkholderia]|uniref:DUF3579 domain-containing protein n=1 Tax=Paraburkholderia nemoris TaxID=2793076 RepID=A0ABN7NF16_9BURK|nr:MULTISPECIES: DUF3579 domain-containing protein [Paraburkholderia]MBK5153453.1 DUF3579 domain-containing protein [Burkholderia sp. R-69608]MBK5186419.1 DUF3579 domain-containing protein [Burkholderia sp. R-69749]MBK3816377.1 DUF3579 domain-containing protein [Paraburkholderia aspalathi]CAE6857679.1 hypothetical protein R75777_07872 [Paraburkholderia nemoris]CAE6860568.1 hypothetical protein R69776_07983 [Paraburkholderia nemoris]
MTAHFGTQHFLIKGTTYSGKTFRPSDWAERLTGVITLFVGDRRPGIHIACTPLAMPIVQDDVKCLLVSGDLQLICPAAFEFVARFAEDNDLPIEFRCTRPSEGLDEHGAFAVAEISACPATEF